MILRPDYNSNCFAHHDFIRGGHMSSTSYKDSSQWFYAEPHCCWDSFIFFQTVVFLRGLFCLFEHIFSLLLQIRYRADMWGGSLFLCGKYQLIPRDANVVNNHHRHDQKRTG